MNKRLESKLNNLSIEDNKIDFFDLRDYLFTNKDYRTKGQLSMAIDFLSNKGVVIINVPDGDLVNVIRKKVDIKKNESEDIVDLEKDDDVDLSSDLDLFMGSEIEEEEEEVIEESSKNRYFNTNTTAFSLYLKDISNQDKQLLSSEQEIDLFTKLQQGDESIKDFLIESNLKLVVSIAKYYLKANSTMDLEDIVQEGNIGLMKAIDKFDPSLGYRFSTYATWWIKQSISRALSDQGRTIRLPVHLVDQALVFNKVHDILFYQSDGKEPTYEEIAKYANENGYNRKSKNSDGVRPPLTASDVEFYMHNYNSSPVSIDMKIGEDEDSCLIDFIEDTISESPWHYTEKKALRESLVKAMHKVLKEKEIKVIILRFGLDSHEPRTLQEVGEIIGVTRERIRQIEEKAKRKLRRVPELEGVILRRQHGV